MGDNVEDALEMGCLFVVLRSYQYPLKCHLGDRIVTAPADDRIFGIEYSWSRFAFEYGFRSISISGHNFYS